VPFANPNQYGAVTFVRDDTTGVLTLAPNTTVSFVNPCDPVFIEPKARFLYGGCGNGLSMYTLDPATGKVAEVPTSPFAASVGNTPAGFSAESTGQYVYLFKAIYNAPSSSQSLFLDTFKVDPNTPALVPISSQTLPVSGTFVAPVADPKGHGFTFLLNQDQGGPNPVPVIYTVTFDPSTGLPFLPSGGTSLPGIDAKYMLIDVKGDFMAANYGQQAEFITVFHLSTTNFQTLTSNTFQIPDPNPGNATRGFFFDPSGGILYVQYFNTGTVNPTNFHVFDSATLSELSSSPLPLNIGKIDCGLSDPYGPFAYCITGPSLPSPGISVFQIDPITGIPSQPGPISAPFYPQLSVTPVILTATASQQNNSVPDLTWSPASVTFNPTQIGQSSVPQVVTVKNIGTLLASFSSISISGVNASDFSTSADQCMTSVILQPGNTCTLSITYSPLAAGTSQATLVLTDDALRSPQMIALSGTAVPPTPAVALNPSGTLTFPGTTTQGTSSAPQNITLTNTGNGPLHVTNLAVTGFNSNDFIVNTSNCLGTVAAGANCIIPITFAPLAAGIRTTTFTLTDDASNSPQTVSLSGDASPAVTPAPSSQSTASVSAGQTALYQIQLTPGSGFAGVISLACSGAPLYATCQVPASVSISNGTAAPFTVTVSTKGGAMIPPSIPRRFLPPAGIRVLLLLALALLLANALKNGWTFDRPLLGKRLAFSGALAAILLSSVIYTAGCGSSSSVITTPPPVVTPSGTSTITITMGAMSPTQQPLQLQPVQLTLTVK
jgi:hypothetical protein